MKRVVLADLPVERVVHDPAIAKQVSVRAGEVHELRNPGDRDLVALYLGVRA